MVGDDDVIEVAGIGDAADGAEGLFALRSGDVAAGIVGVLADDGVADGGDRDLIGGEFVVIDPDIDGAVEAAADLDFADAEERSSCTFTTLSASSVSSRKERGPARAMVMMAFWSLSNFEMIGGSASRGRSRRMAATRSRTSCVATSMLRSRAKVALTQELPGVAMERSSSTPATVLRASSMR